jgi:hypothetical protein
MKRYAPWLLVAFVLALLLPLGLRADRPTRVFLDSPIGRASYLDISRLLVPAVAVKPGKFWLHLEARRSRAGPDESIPLRSNFSFDHALLRADDTGPPWIDLCGPPVSLRAAPRLKLQGPPGSPVGLPRRETTRQNLRKPGVRKNRGSATRNFYDRL